VHGESKSPQVVNIAEGEKRLRGKSLLDEINLSKIKGMNDSERDGIRRAGIELQGGWELTPMVLTTIVTRGVEGQLSL